MGTDPLPVQLLNRMVVLTGIYQRYREYDAKLQAGSPAVRLADMFGKGEIPKGDRDFIQDLIDRKAYRKR